MGDASTGLSDAITIQTQGPAETEAVGKALGTLATAGTVILLHGDLGAGKTTLTKGIAVALHITDPVQSPTFTLVAEHAGYDRSGNPRPLYHLDLYRLTDPQELESFGFEEYLGPPDGITVIEWPERAGSRLPAAYIFVQLRSTGPATRTVTIAAFPSDGPYEQMISDLRTSYS